VYSRPPGLLADKFLKDLSSLHFQQCAACLLLQDLLQLESGSVAMEREIVATEVLVLASGRFLRTPKLGHRPASRYVYLGGGTTCQAVVNLLCASCCNSLGQVHKSPVNAMGVHTVTLNGVSAMIAYSPRRWMSRPPRATARQRRRTARWLHSVCTSSRSASPVEPAGIMHLFIHTGTGCGRQAKWRKRKRMMQIYAASCSNGSG